MTGLRIEVGDERIRARDGVLLAADLWYPDDGKQHPVLLMRGPYLRAAARAIVDITGLLRDGWALVISDTRGRGDSGGDGAPLVSEQSDGYDTISWCAQQAWSDGRVAMHGSSYLGFTQWQAAATGHPALKAIAPLHASASGRDAWFYERDALLGGFAAQYGAFMGALDPATAEPVRDELIALMSRPADLVATPASHHRLRSAYPPYENWIHPERDDYWDRFAVSPMSHSMDVAGYHVAGWYDIFCEESISLWRQLRENARSEYARASQRLTIGFWAHGMTLQALPEVDYGHGADLGTSGTAARMHGWLRAALDREPVEDGIRAFVMGVNRWWDMPDWPPPSREVGLRLGSGPEGARSSRGDGTLTGQSDPGAETSTADSSVDEYDHDPANPIPTVGGRTLGLWRPLPGPYDQRAIEERDDVLVYTGDHLTAQVTIAGMVRVHLNFETNGTSADVVTKLIDVHPDGRALNIVDGVQRFNAVPGRVVGLNLEIGSVAHTFLPGHCIRLTIAGSNAPRVQPNPSVPALPWEKVEPRMARHRIHLGGVEPSQLLLPVVTNLDGSNSDRSVAP